MQQQTILLFYRFRFIFIGIFIIAFFVMIAALVTVIGSNTVLATNPNASTSSVGANQSYSSNVVTDGMTALAADTERVMLTAGTGLYQNCRAVTITSTRIGRSAANDSAVIVHSVGGSIAFVGRGVGDGIAFTGHTVSSGVMSTVHIVGSGVMFNLRIPGKIVGSIARVHSMGAIIRPVDENPVPAINNMPPALLARLSAQAQLDQKKYSQLLAAQLVANQDLGGSAVAGDPDHGGYPSKWDSPAYQDSRLDSWGMYNRECVSYTAWKVYQTYGDMPYWGGVGNTNQWVIDAQRAGIPTGSTPRVHSVAISMHGYYGHAMWVEAVKGDMIYVSQYNYDLHGHYSEMWLSSSALTYIYFK